MLLRKVVIIVLLLLNDIELIAATSRCDIEAIKVLLNEGIDINLQNEQGVSALYTATVYGNMDRRLEVIHL